MKYLNQAILLTVFFFSQLLLIGQTPSRHEGDGPFNNFIIRGVTIIDGTGNPPYGPVDIVINNNRIAGITIVGAPGQPIDSKRRPVLQKGGKELDASGMYIMPGFIDMHAHIKSWVDDPKNFEYVFKLWMAHGVTSIAEPGCFGGLDIILETRKRSDQNEITAPRIKAYAGFRTGIIGTAPINTPEEAREWVRSAKKKGVDGIKFLGQLPDLMAAATDEGKKLGLRSMIHHSNSFTGQWNALNSAKAGIVSLEHLYGIPEMILADNSLPTWPSDYNYSNEQPRFLEAGRMWLQTVPPYSPKWNNAIDSLLKYGLTLDPTFNVYEANRDVMRARTAEWHTDYMMPKLWQSYTPGWNVHGAYFRDWGTEEELVWKKTYQLWMAFVNEYKNRGGRVTAGTDSNIFNLFGFTYIRELELLREAGFTPLEVIRAATLAGAEALGMENELGTIRVGKLADLVIVEENPLANFKTLYGTGAIKLTDKNELIRIGGVKYTIKDGIIYDAKQLLADVKKMVADERKNKNFKLVQPGF
jgi:dihydroorotase-like cyclic amidohydrolase